MTLQQTNQAIKTLREMAQHQPWSMDMHDQITRTLLNLLHQKEALSSKKKKCND
jgi:hypothetical protein